MAARHPFPKFRVLKQAWRDYLAENCTLAVTLPVNVSVAGRVLAAGTMRPRGTQQVRVTLVEDEAEPRTVKGDQVVPVTINGVDGAWTATFTGVPAGAYKLKVSCGMQPSIAMETTNAFTVT